MAAKQRNIFPFLLGSLNILVYIQHQIRLELIHRKNPGGGGGYGKVVRWNVVEPSDAPDLGNIRDLRRTTCDNKKSVLGRFCPIARKKLMIIIVL